MLCFRTPLKSSGYSSLSRVERDLVSAAPTVSREVNREVVRNYVTGNRIFPLHSISLPIYVNLWDFLIPESHVVPSHVSPVAPQSVPAVVCGKCQGHSNVNIYFYRNFIITYKKFNIRIILDGNSHE